MRGVRIFSFRCRTRPQKADIQPDRQSGRGLTDTKTAKDRTCGQKSRREQTINTDSQRYTDYALYASWGVTQDKENKETKQTSRDSRFPLYTLPGVPASIFFTDLGALARYLALVGMGERAFEMNAKGAIVTSLVANGGCYV